MEESRYTTTVEYPECEPSIDPPSDPRISIIVPASGSKNRTAEELLLNLNEVKVDSVRDICEQFDVRIEGNYQDANGNNCSVDFQAQDENSFTPRGLTFGDSGLCEMYMMQRVCENISTRSIAEADGLLTEEALAQLDADIAILTKAKVGD